MLANIVSLVMMGVRNTHTIPSYGYISENEHFVKTQVKAAKTPDATVSPTCLVCLSRSHGSLIFAWIPCWCYYSLLLLFLLRRPWALGFGYQMSLKLFFIRRLASCLTYRVTKNVRVQEFGMQYAVVVTCWCGLNKLDTVLTK